ncbi:DISP complex protein LRCH3 isoform X2 [Centruroides vittatus]|uniref:DISP complex protein LRCH3 isoform X2 n=1 Tax=Centruroides vittatus TaxID=120091 RepID=UPI00351058E5
MALTALGLGSQSSTQLTRTLEKVFEDAQLTGELKLSGRKLREYPKLASEYDLCDTVAADLSKNRFTELPSEICEFFLLEQLDCYHNVMRAIPESVITLQSLSYLNLSRNQLTTIPPSLCQLPLQVLILSNNRLVSIPEEIGHMHCLSNLDISCNELSILPPQIGDLDSLKSLNIRRNQLVELPSEVCELQLVKLDISANRITTLPPNLRFMYSLQEFILDCNPLSSPPAFLCKRGRTHIFKYLEIQAIKEDKKRGILLESEFRRSCRKLGILSDLRYQNGLTSDNCRKRYTLDSGYNTSDGSDKRWSQDFQELNGDLEDSHHLALRAAALAKGRQEREWLYNSSDTITPPTSVILNSNNESPNGLSSISTPSTLSPTSEINVEEVFMKESQKEQITDVYEQSKDDYRRMARKVLEQQREEARKLQERSPSKVLALKKDSCNINNSPVLNSLNCSQTCRQLNENLRYQTITDGLNKRPQSDKCHNPIDASQQTLTLPNHTLLEKNQHDLINNDINDDFMEKSDENWKRTQKDAFLLYMKGSSWNTKSGNIRLSNGTHHSTRREIDKVKEEKKQVDHLRCIIEAKLKVTLPEDLGSALMDGVVLCHLANRVRPHSVASIHVPSPAVPKLSLAKCRKNVENFLEACKRIGVPKAQLCRWEEVVLKLHVGHVACTVRSLLYTSQKNHQILPTVCDVILSFFLLNLLLGTLLLFYFYPPS